VLGHELTKPPLEKLAIRQGREQRLLLYQQLARLLLHLSFQRRLHAR
jgi:hypothetical protein